MRLLGWADLESAQAFPDQLALGKIEIQSLKVKKNKHPRN
jgi:hypothetical protein